MQQPESNIVMLHLAVTKQKDRFKAAMHVDMQGPLKDTGATLTFRPTAKALFRCLVKSLL